LGMAWRVHGIAADESVLFVTENRPVLQL
jgi:hypothetical protein